MLIYVLAVSAALVSLLALALNSAQKTAEEDLAAARRLRIENIAAQASAAAEAWFYDSAAAIAEEAGFESGAAPESDPTPDETPTPRASRAYRRARPTRAAQSAPIT